MAELKDLQKGAQVRGIVPDVAVTIVDATRLGSAAVNLTYRNEQTGDIGSRLVLGFDVGGLTVERDDRQWAFDGDGARFRLALEARRIQMAFMFDTLLGITTSKVDPLPHQISAVYERLLKQQPLRFLLADDPGAGKTIMAGLLIKELMLRGDLERCLIVVPASLADQWKVEMQDKFNIDFRIFGRSEIADAHGNPFANDKLVISRLDLLKQDQNMELLRQSDWDLVVVDEAHKMSATYDSAGGRRETARYKLGKLLGEHTRHLLLMTATPHRGKDEDFQLFMALLDPDRFEGKYRAEVHRKQDVSDIMRRLLKEDILDFDGRHLFPERFADTVSYQLSRGEDGNPSEHELYRQVTSYVREQMGRAEAIVREAEQQKATGDGDGKTRGAGEAKQRSFAIGFALTILQRRLASSPNAIYRSLNRRRERLEKALREKQTDGFNLTAIAYLPENMDELDDRSDEDAEVAELLSSASAATSLRELQQEIDTLTHLENIAKTLVDSGSDSKWRRLRQVLLEEPEMLDPHGQRFKLVIFTEHRDTLTYLSDKIGELMGKQAITTIHGSMRLEERLANQDEFVNNPDVRFLVATDAAGEGINLQRAAHLMVNYDLPWNPNRLEQRFGRIHRYGQTEKCFCWNLIASDTREGQVFETILGKLNEMREALGDRVFDVLGTLFEEAPLDKLVMGAVLKSEQDDGYMQQVIELVDKEHFVKALEENALNKEDFGPGILADIKELVQRAEVSRLVPYFIASFFLEAFRNLGGEAVEREAGRYEIKFVPNELRARARRNGHHIVTKYARICFDKADIAAPGHSRAALKAEFIAPGHSLLDTVVELLLEREGSLLREGTILVDHRPDAPANPRVMFCVRQDITDQTVATASGPHVVSSALNFVEIDADGNTEATRQGPYLDYRPLQPHEVATAAQIRHDWLSPDVEQMAVNYAIGQLLPAQLQEVTAARTALLAKTEQAVRLRLEQEIVYWDSRAQQFKEQELAGKQPKMNSEAAARRRDELLARLDSRMAKLKQERNIGAQLPLVVAGALVIPAALLPAAPQPAADGEDEFQLPYGGDPAARRRIEQLAMAAVMEAERRMGFEPCDVSAINRGFDIESRSPRDAYGRPADPDVHLRFIEVKGRAAAADVVTITRNECIAGLNSENDFILAIALIAADEVVALYYVPDPIHRIMPAQPDWSLISFDADIKQLLAYPGVRKLL